MRCYSPSSREIRMSNQNKIHSGLAEAMAARSYEKMTPVQEAVLKIEKADADLLVSAQTGSGKTLAFGISIANTLLAEKKEFNSPRLPNALIIAPTRELALQVRKELEWLYARVKAQFASCVGGMDPRAERRTLESGAHIVVGTPGRLRDHVERGALCLSDIKAVVLDEADEMLDMGFREDLTFILEKAPVSRRTLLFSATVPAQIAKLARTYQKEAIRISVSSSKQQHLDITYHAIKIHPSDREKAIINLLRYYDVSGTIIFCNTRAAVTHLASRLSNRGISVVALSGELSQKDRNFALQSMRVGRAEVCVATDVAARGIDLPNLDLVIHADLPQSDEVMLHRSGRTGRAGRKGTSIILIPNRNFKRVERMFRNNGIEPSWVGPPSAEQIIEQDRIKILKSEFLNAPIDEAEVDIIQRIIKKYSPEAIASAFVRSQMAGKSAPEELSSINTAGPADFSNSTWFELSIGHRDNAEPRWLVAMLCRIGNMDKSLIGDIQIHNSTTFIEIASNGVQQLITELKPDYLIEGRIEIKELLTAPERIPTVRERKFLSSRRGVKSEVRSRQNTKQSFRLKKEKDNKQKSKNPQFGRAKSDFLKTNRHQKSEGVKKFELQGQEVQKKSSKTLKLDGNTKRRKKNIKGELNDKTKKSRNRKNKILRKVEGGKVPLKRKRV